MRERCEFIDATVEPEAILRRTHATVLAPSSARVVKAFNTLSAETMTDPSLAGGTVTIPVAGNDPQAKMIVSGLVTGLGFDVVDMGGIESARALEQMLVVRGTAGALGQPFNYYFRPMPSAQ